ncbi:MAG: ferredoxin reductase [Kofleriaceae bacterium]|nr:MAG: ferredoxin reductase [Kofleriaceae bacterium]MBZ0234365.1 ferredoxin reductase [Kofleriaceae bacterium]
MLHARRLLNAVLRTPLFTALATPHDIDGYLRMLDRTWSARHVRARLVAIRRETDDAVSLWLLPNENWRGFRAGQFVQLSVWVGGIRHTRCYSISSAPEDGLPLRLTLEVQPIGRVSSAWLRQAREGDVVELSPALGDFVLPEPAPARLLFVSGGSGITPLLSMSRHLNATGYAGRLAWVHYARRAVILGDELRELARRQPGLQLDVRLTEPARSEGAPAPRLSGERLDALVPDWEGHEAFACGPASLLGSVASVWHERAAGGRLHVERFDAGADASPSRSTPWSTETPYRLVFARSGREARGHGRASLLAQAEAAGLQPRHGCRIGICHRCRCVKRAGVVRNELTGVLDDEPDKAIQLCITTPCSDVILEL